jgi:hypothetical protein
MSVPSPSPDARPADRGPSPAITWGPLALVLVVLLVVGIVATAKGRSSTTAASGGSATTTPAGGATTGPKSWADNPVLPVTYADAKKAGTLDDYDWGEHCDPETGRLKIPSVYSPPCTPVWDGTKPWKDSGGKVHTDNGGATAPGVTAKEITIVYYVPSVQDLFSTAAALGVLDTPALMAQQAEQFTNIYNQLFELYGRKVKLVKFQATGNGVDPTASRSDAIKVATQYHAFASIGGPSQSGAYADELARRKVLCIACGLSVPDSDFQKNAPYMWGTLPTPEQFVRGVFDFGIANLWNRPARFAGDPKMRKEQRVIGVVYYEQNPPVFTNVRKETLEHYSKLGYQAKSVQTYLLDTATLNSQAQTIVGHLKADGVTTVVFLGDPLMPKFLTSQAASQDYHPEWVITGTAFTDTTAAARLYDPTEWAHAFGTSTMPARGKPELQDSWRLVKWFTGADPVAKKSQAFLGPALLEAFLGLHMAGPDLTPFTFAGGMFNYPPSGGGATEPRISFGFHGQFPNADYVGADDFTVVWWDANAVGPDEQDKVGKGMWAYVQDGKRYLLGTTPPKVGDQVLFDPKLATTLLQTIPASSRTPNYAPWKGFPTAATGN